MFDAVAEQRNGTSKVSSLILLFTVAVAVAVVVVTACVAVAVAVAVVVAVLVTGVPTLVAALTVLS